MISSKPNQSYLYKKQLKIESRTCTHTDSSSPQYRGAEDSVYPIYLLTAKKATQSHYDPPHKEQHQVVTATTATMDNKPAHLNNAKKEQKIPIYIQKLQKGIGTWKT